MNFFGQINLSLMGAHLNNFPFYDRKIVQPTKWHPVNVFGTYRSSEGASHTEMKRLETRG